MAHYAACEAAFKGFELELSPQTWHEFRILEAAAKHLLNGGKFDAEGEAIQ
jgi:hypothetical protein